MTTKTLANGKTIIWIIWKTIKINFRIHFRQFTFTNWYLRNMLPWWCKLLISHRPACWPTTRLPLSVFVYLGLYFGVFHLDGGGIMQLTTGIVLNWPEIWGRLIKKDSRSGLSITGQVRLRRWESWEQTWVENKKCVIDRRCKESL